MARLKKAALALCGGTAAGRLFLLEMAPALSCASARLQDTTPGSRRDPGAA